MTTITIGSSTYNLVALPTSPAAAEIELGMNDSVAVITSPFTRTEQTQRWPGGDFWDATITLPPLTKAQAADWEGFLAALQGRANVFQIGDGRAIAPLGVARGVPVVDSSNPANNLPMMTSLTTKGWTASVARQLLRGDQFQIGYRLHRVTEIVNSDASGNATISIWPGLRETPATGTSLVLARPKGLFRLAQNRRAAHASPARLTSISLQCVEVR